jgi:signal transduction histidine kinase
VTLSRLIDDLFTLARVEETSLPLAVRTVAAAQAAAEAVAGLKALAWEQSKVTVLSLVEDDTPSVRADPTRLRQILNNLLYNALRHTPSGGLVVVNARPNGTRVEFSVADTGVGIPPEERERVFDRFYAGARSMRTKGDSEATGRDEGGEGASGSGLGLHIVQQLVEAMGGTIAVESEPGQGTVFRFDLPKAAGGRPAARS